MVFGMGMPKAEDETGALLAGRYRLLEVLGVGGTATIYKSLDERTRAPVAVKVLHKGARDQVGPFFGQEGRIAARFSNPHLVLAYDFGVDEGRPFIVFQYLEGESLADLYAGRLMPWRELLVVVLQVLQGLAPLHAHGIVHRDVKPDNVHVSRLLGGDLHVTLLDVGFAWVPPTGKITNAPVPNRMVFGTYGFIAPEALAGYSPEPRQDLYSVGALMYKMLTSQDVPDLGAAPEMMCLPSPRAFVPTIPQAVDDLVMRALSDVEARFQSAEEMMTAIRTALAADDAAAATASDVPTCGAGTAVHESAVRGDSSAVVKTTPAVFAGETAPSVRPATVARGLSRWWSGAVLALGVGLGVVGTVGVQSFRGADGRPGDGGVAVEGDLRARAPTVNLDAGGGGVGGRNEAARSLGAVAAGSSAKGTSSGRIVGAPGVVEGEGLSLSLALPAPTMRDALAAAAADLRACAGLAGGLLLVEFKTAPGHGSFAAATPVGENDPAVGRCVREVVERVRFLPPDEVEIVTEEYTP
ncbi:MAG TPA: serine/threonine-protein kinase [Nannocystis sp.]